MHILTNKTPIHAGTLTLPPGEWLVQDQNAFELGMMGERGMVALAQWRGVNPKTNMWYRDQSNPELIKSILLIRSGAIGDLLLLTPAIKSLRVEYPNAQIWLSCFKKHWDVFALGDTHFLEYPLPVSELDKFDLIIPLENIVELSTDKGQHATDAYAEALGVTVTDYKPVYKVTMEEKASVTMPKERKRVGLQLRASTPIRDYPMDKWMAVMQELLTRGWEIMLLGNRDSIAKLPAHIHDCSQLSFRESAAVLSTCDVFCGVDSAFFNLCPALDVPAVGLFGPVDWRTRIKEGSGQVAISGVGDCCPCNWTNSRQGKRFPAHGPCSKSGRCEPLADISPMRIVQVIEREAKK